MMQSMQSAHETQHVIRQLKTILVTDLALNLREDDIPDDVSLLEGGLALDSVVIAELIGQVEDQFGVRFDDENLREDVFANLTTLAELVAGKRQAAKKTA
jgi:acyl carrier protein